MVGKKKKQKTNGIEHWNPNLTLYNFVLCIVFIMVITLLKLRQNIEKSYDE